MDQKLSAITQIFKTNNFLFDNAFNDINREDLLKRPLENGNSMLFIGGHITLYRYSIGNLIGLNNEKPWESLFARGVKITSEAKYPTFEAIKEHWDMITNQIFPRFETVSSEELSQTTPFDLPTSDKTICGAIGFMALHETYHIGQLAYIRKLLGYNQLVG